MTKTTPKYREDEVYMALVVADGERVGMMSTNIEDRAGENAWTNSEDDSRV
jgi:hypothetical protein